MTLRLNGSTSGYVEIDAPAVAGTTSISFPATTGEAIVKAANGSVDLGSIDIDSSGRLLVGTSTARSNFFNTTLSSAIQVEGTTFSSSSASLIANGSTGASDPVPYLVLGRSRGTLGGQTVVQNNDSVGLISFQGSDGTEFVELAQIQAYVNGTPGANDMPGALVFSTTGDGGSSPTERMRIDNSGNLLVGTASGSARLNLSAGAQVAATVTNTNTNDLIAVKGNAGGSSGSSVYVMPMRFGDDTLRGSIFWNGSTVAYNTTSDYRLKENVNTYTGALNKLANLRPVTYNFTDNPGVSLDGFIAHEVQNVVPNAVSGIKDEVDSEGNPLYQGLDTAKLVPLLTAALQEAVAKIESLETRIAALEVTP